MIGSIFVKYEYINPILGTGIWRLVFRGEGDIITPIKLWKEQLLC